MTTDTTDDPVVKLALARGLVGEEGLSEAVRLRQTQEPGVALGALLVRLGHLGATELDALQAVVDEARRAGRDPLAAGPRAGTPSNRTPAPRPLTPRRATPTPGGGASSAPAPPPGRPFGKYVLVQEVGRGGMGVVYKAYDLELRRTVALKVLASEAANEENLKRFYKEAQVAANLRHPHIARIYEVGQEGESHYFTMDFIEGRGFDDWLIEEDRPASAVIAMVVEVASAVQAAHDIGVIHRDIKPSNVLVDREGRPWLTDFGLARRVMSSDKLTVTGMTIGTPSYMSPEQARGEVDDLDARSDVYALGAFLYHGLARRPPFSGASDVETMFKVVNADPESLRRIDPRVPADVETICSKAMSKERERRYASAIELARDLERFLRGEAVVARPSSILYRVQRRIKRHRGVAIATGTIVLALCVVAGYGQIERLRLDRRQKKDAEVRAQKEAELARLLAEAKRKQEAHAQAQAAFDAGEFHTGLVRIEDYTKAIALDPEFADAYYERARVYREEKDPAKARADLDRAIALRPAYIAAFVERAGLLAELGEKGLAREDCLRASRLVNADDARLALEAQAAVYAGDAKAALGLADQAVAANGKNGEARLLRGRLRAEGGNAAGAREDLDLVPTLSPALADEARRLLKELQK